MTLEVELRALRSEYAARLPEKLVLLATAVRAAVSDPAYIPYAVSLAHRLAGTAGSYGFAAVGSAAGRLEEALGGSGEATGAAIADALEATQIAIAAAAAAEAP